MYWKAKAPPSRATEPKRGNQGQGAGGLRVMSRLASDWGKCGATIRRSREGKGKAARARIVLSLRRGRSRIVWSRPAR